ncbi:MAG: hypothetical protein HRT44_03900 [Bdellovibrionales bacterium]|nr:hypothetical protein [Bdellovibrionales bacterium]NQZ18387.1 hypothetical protein [Bdellovibrionales bacterium]
MFIQKYIWAAVAGVLSLGLGAYWGGINQKNFEEAYVPVVKTYKVPADRAGEIKSILNDLFYQEDKKGSSRAQAIGNNLLLVKAPIGFHKGIQGLISNIEGRSPTKNKKVHIDYWVVLATDNGLKNPGNTKEISKAIESIKEVSGDGEFRVLEHLSANTSNGRSVEVRGWLSNAETNVGFFEDNIFLRMKFRSDFGEVKTSTKTTDGEFIILGQSAMRPKRLERLNVLKAGALAHDVSAKVYYIVRAKTVK